MRVFLNRRRLITASSLFLAGAVLIADGTRFSDFTPLTASSGPAADEEFPLILSSEAFEQRSIANRQAQLDASIPNSGNWDMITTNETRPHAGRFLFTVFETGQSGVQRHDLETGVTDTIWHSPNPGDHVAFDPSVLDSVGHIHYG